MIWHQKKSEWTCCCALSHLLGKIPLFAQDVWDGCLSIKPSRISNIGMFQHKSLGFYRQPPISTCRDASKFECLFNMSTRYEEQFPFFLSSATQMLRKKVPALWCLVPLLVQTSFPGGLPGGSGTKWSCEYHGVVGIWELWHHTEGGQKCVMTEVN